ncbi:ribosome quality control complex subunit TCF25-like isoform X2 [Corticium candelabrum]|uniref:ribosome quality control complex subunit TCF25-like isoform X2 n=1 Tax=Corticium candelabrum TaxID=121492 RepID=UPI002E276E22|nr:ribosome quality control complex subunit TCF25-like isoform X2 [Corticium candelabrum]
MSSRALRRLQRNREVEDADDDDVGIVSTKSKIGAFALLDEDVDQNCEQEEESDESREPVVTKPSQSRSQRAKKKKKKKSERKGEQTKENVVTGDVDADIKAVSEMLGEAVSLSIERPETSAPDMKSLLTVEHRRRGHRRVYHRATWLATPQDSWPQMTKMGLSMDLIEKKNGCQHFSFVHSPQYQTIQFSFLDAVESFNPDNISAVLRLYPYHIDSLLQLSEVCKMSEDRQMANELLERALYAFECSFHTLFNMTQGNCRLDFRKSENRSFFYALFRHLVMVGQRGCCRTALEFCKVLLSLDPDNDPLCVLLMMDFYALRAEEFRFLIRMFNEWESHRNLSQLPNWAFSVPLAMFSAAVPSESEDTSEADKMLQNSLLMFPSVFTRLLDKCSVEFNSGVMKHSYFGSSAQSSEPAALNQLISLFIERSHSLWKIPEVLLWLERNARIVCQRVDNQDPLIQRYKTCRVSRYQGTPRNIYRHIILSDYRNVLSSLPREIAEKPVMMHDPLPPLDSVSSYTRPPRQTALGETNQNPLSLFFSSLMPSFNPQAPAAQGGDTGPVAALSQSLRELLAALRGPQGESDDLGPPVDEVD